MMTYLKIQDQSSGNSPRVNFVNVTTRSSGINNRAQQGQMSVSPAANLQPTGRLQRSRKVFMELAGNDE